MKRKLIILLLCCGLLLVGCGNSSFESQWATDASGNRVLVYEGSNTVFPDSLPADIAYNSSSIEVKNATLYQDRLSDYSYSLTLVVEIDVSGLDDAQLHWLRESDIDVNAYLTSEKNDYDFSSMTALGNLLVTDMDTLYYVTTSSFFKENRYDFTESKITLNISLVQEETYKYTYSDGDTKDKHREEALQYTFTAGADLPSSENIPEPLYGYIVKWLQDYKITF